MKDHGVFKETKEKQKTDDKEEPEKKETKQGEVSFHAPFFCLQQIAFGKALAF
jgi:hypothetical protein